MTPTGAGEGTPGTDASTAAESNQDRIEAVGPTASGPDREPAFGPHNVIGGGLQHERTALAWERTAIAMMVAGVVLARYAAESVHFTLGLFGVAQTAAGGLLLAWAGRNNEKLHSIATPPSAVPQLALTRLVGAGTVVFTGVALLLSALIALAI